jgi:hypothetical protein
LRAAGLASRSRYISVIGADNAGRAPPMRPYTSLAAMKNDGAPRPAAGSGIQKKLTETLEP